jgi:ribonuclease J
VRFWPVDHSIPGATGFAVETAAGWVAYTGDIRFHGRSGENTRRFGEGLASLRPKALLCEGTRLTEPNRTSEQEVGENCLRAVQEAQGKLVVADFAPRNVERLVVFASVAAQTGRRLLVQPRDAYLLRAIALADPQLGDAMEDEHVGLYADPKAQIRAWEEAVRGRYRERTVSPLEVKDDPGAYILAFSLTEMSDMVDIEYLMNGRIGGIYVFSNSQAYDEEQKVDLVRLWSWTQYLGLKMVGLVPSQKGAGG